jgi:hypothetical protein
LSCPQTCFEPYLRQELSYFDIVRDRHESDWTALVVRQLAANGGERFTVSLRPSAALASPPPREFLMPPVAQPEAMRKRLLEELLALLYLSQQGSPHAAAFQLSLPRREGTALSRLDDPWDYWAISPEVKGFAELQSEFHQAEVTGALTLRRTTERHKLRLRGSYSRQLSRFVLEGGSEVTGDIYAWEGRAIYAHSLGRRWALGFAATERARQGENLRGQLQGGPVVELNLFPYSDNVTKQIRLAYQAGPLMNWYFEPTREGKRHEVRPYHALTLVADANQHWGSVQWAVQLTSLLDEPDKYRVGSSTVLSLQLFEGFALTLQGFGAVVHDQINLRARPPSDNEILLGTVQQATSFVLEAEFGFSYTFGSIHNTIVNPRFGRLDLEEE